MKTSIAPTPHCLRLFTVWLVAMLFHVVPAWSQVTPVGGTARQFTVTNLETGQPIRMTDFAGKVLVLDFFAYWCGPCQTSSPDLEKNVQEYYAARGGNANGVPVQVLAVSVDDSNPAATDTFIANAGLKLTGEDPMTAAGAWQQFSETGGIPLFVIINGVNGSPSHTQYEVIYKRAGYAGSPALRAVIDEVMPAPKLDDAEIAVDGPGGGPLSNNGPAVTLGNVVVGAVGIEQTFTIHNNGQTSLTGISVTNEDGPNAGDFTLNTSSTATTLGGGSITTFTVTFGPTAAGLRKAVLHIASSDSGANPFTITLAGMGIPSNGTTPLLEVSIDNSPLVQGSAAIAFGDANIGGKGVERSIVVRNLGNAPLTGLLATISGTHESDFTMDRPLPASIAPGKSANLTVRFQPVAKDLRSATLRIASNDSTQNPFEIEITGTGSGKDLPSAPDISITQGKGKGSNLKNRRSTRNLGTKPIGRRGKAMTFEITNQGTSDLKMLRVKFKGRHQNEFVLIKDVAVRTLAPGKTTTFKIALRPRNPGVRRTTLQVFSNDKDENPFKVRLKGRGKTR